LVKKLIYALQLLRNNAGQVAPSCTHLLNVKLLTNVSVLNERPLAIAPHLTEVEIAPHLTRWSHSL